MSAPVAPGGTPDAPDAPARARGRDRFRGGRYRNVSAWAIRHPVQTIVLFLLLSAAGIAAFPFLRINVTPDLDLPAVVVTVAQPGAAPSELETQVTRRVEDAVSGLGDVRHTMSTVVDGASTTVVEFVFGTEVDRKVSDIRDRLSQIRADLPADIREPQVSRVEVTGAPIATYAVRMPGLSAVETSWFVDDAVTRALLAEAGVARVSRVGGADREIRVALDPDRLAALGVTAAEVNNQLRDLNLDRPGGRGTLGGREQSVRTLGAAPSLEALRQRSVILPGGRTARLDTLGTVSDATAERRTGAMLDGAPVVAFEVLRTRGSSEVHVAARVERAVARLAASHPGAGIVLVSSTTPFVLAAYHGAMEALAVGAALATAVVFLFLRNARATLIAAVAMPLSLVPAFAAMQAMGFSLNNVTLLGITLVVGVLVDDAIVEIENIIRHLREGRARGITPWEAAIEASSEIGLAVVATTATILAVFVPVAFMPGIPGQFFREFGLTVAASVAFSLVVARLLTPMLGAYLLRPRDALREEREGPLTRAYLRLLGWCLRHRAPTLLGGALFFAGSVALVPLLPQDFVPAADRGRSTLAIELSPGATLADTEAAVLQASAILRARPEVVSVFAALGVSRSAVLGGSGGASHAGDPRLALLSVNLLPRGERALTQGGFESAVRPELERIPGARLRFGEQGESGTVVSVTLAADPGTDPAALAGAAARLEREMRGVPGLAGARSTASLARPELRIVPDPERMAELGVSVATLANTARVATLGEVDAALPRYNLPDRQVPIRVMLTEAARSDPDALRSLRVPASRERSVPLGAVAAIELGAGPTQVDRLDRARKVTVEAELGGMPLGQATALIAALPAMRGLPPGVREIATGDVEVMAELFGGFFLALGAGVLIVYLVLVVLFGGFLQPLTIMTALPLSLGGALLGLMLAQKALGVSAVIGVLMLMGIVAKNSILLVEYAIEARRAGADPVAAMTEAARKRARPIVMTTIAMTAGMAHIALGVGADSEFRAPMAIVVIGGLVTSTLLSLVFVPAAYLAMEGLSRRLSRPGRRGRVAKAGTSAGGAVAGGAPAAAE